METYKQPLALISGLKKLTKENLSNLTPHPLYVFLHYSHPPILARIDAIRKQHQLQVGGTTQTTTKNNTKHWFWLV